MLHALIAVALTVTPTADLEEITPSEGGWVELFDGKTLKGWTPTGGRYDGKAEWTVEDGAIVGREASGGAGGLLYTEKEYENFEVEFDAWISYPFDSGIFPRMKPRSEGNKLGAQLTLDHRPGGEIGAVYSDGFYQHNWTGSDKFKRDGWNQIRLRCVGTPMHLVCWVNGELLTDYQLPEDSGNFATEGKLGLQVHGSSGAPEGSKAMFRNLRLRTLPSGNSFEPMRGKRGKAGFVELTKVGKEAGWRSLFNGKNLDGWKPHGGDSGYVVKEGEMRFLNKGSSHHLRTTEDFQDFQLRLEFQIDRSANSGLFLRGARNDKDPAYSGCELQILDDFNYESDKNSKLKDYQFTAGLYGAKAPDTKDALKPLGEWNTYDVYYRGNRMTVRLNGKPIHDVDTHKIGAPRPSPSVCRRGSSASSATAPAAPRARTTPASATSSSARWTDYSRVIPSKRVRMLAPSARRPLCS